MQNEFKNYTAARKANVRTLMRKEFTDFFVTMTTATDRGWPTIDDQELVDALADSLLAMGDARGKGVALLQTLVHELQDRVNQSLN
jgi:hypothetical protein